MLLAHGIGGRGDLPVPFSLALVGAGVGAGRVLRRPRAGPGVRRASRTPSPVVRCPPGWLCSSTPPASGWACGLSALVVTAYVGAAALLGPDLLVNPTFGVVYVLFWVGLVPLSLLFGPVWRLVNPLRTLHALLARALRMRPAEGLLPLPAGLGYWPAAVGLFAFVWLELVAPGATTLAVVRHVVRGLRRRSR